jgi:putative hydrolase of the HAD superfamily
MAHEGTSTRSTAAPKVVFFDVGNTLLFPDRAKILAPLASKHHPTLAQWQALERKTKIEFDRNMETGCIDHSFWQMFHNYLLDDLGLNNGREGLLQELLRNSRGSSNWDQSRPGTREALDRIAARFRIAVISNADGKIDQLLTRCGIADCFESITDSGNVGHEKPSREIFEAALKSMNARAEQSIYVGDVFSVDYLGAATAGMKAVLFDVAGAYRNRPEPRVESLEQLEKWLES